MAVNCDLEQGIAVLSVGGRLDNDGVAEMETKVMDRLDQGDSCIVFDFSELDYINSSGLRVLVMAYQRLKPNGGRVAVCGLKDYILEVFQISGYDKLFAIYPAKAEALDDK